MDKLKLKVPPLVLVCICSVLMLVISVLVPKQEFLGSLGILLSFFCVVIGCLFSLLGVRAFRKAKTTVNPMSNKNTTSLVTTGIYSVTRNPMYVGFLFILIGVALLLSSLFSLVMCIVYVMYMNYFQIKPEEASLESIFAKDYMLYKAKVRRWL